MELIAACLAGKVARYFRYILHDLGFTQNNPTPIYEDNEGTILIAKNWKPSGWTRHINIQYFAIQEWVNKGLVVLWWISSKLNIADGLTKTLSWILHNRHADDGTQWPTLQMITSSHPTAPSYTISPLCPFHTKHLLGESVKTNELISSFLPVHMFTMTITLVLRALLFFNIQYMCIWFQYMCQQFTNIFWAWRDTFVRDPLQILSLE